VENAQVQDKDVQISNFTEKIDDFTKQPILFLGSKS